MNFIAPATAITAAHWNDIFQAADTALTSALGGVSAVLIGVDKQWDRGFFFFDPVTVSPASLHPSASVFLFGSSRYWNNVVTQPALCLRQYNHGAITSLVGGLTVNSTSAKYGVAVLAKPTWAAWSAAIYPSGFGSVSTTGLFSGSVPADNILDCALGVIKVSGNAVTFKDATTAEHAQPLKPVDVFINANVTWDAAWDKYSAERVHNSGRATYTVFGTSINAGSSRCFRKVSGSWAAQGNYFHWMQSGDGRFLQMRESNFPSSVPGGTSPIFQPGIIADVMANTLALAWSNLGKYFDPAKFWNAANIFNNAAYTPTAGEKTPPTGGYFPTLVGSALVGDLIIPRGKFLAYLSSSVHPQV